MANFRMGYIGKSFSMGVLGILGTLVACGGGGVTSSVASVSAPADSVVFAMGFTRRTVTEPDLEYLTAQGGKVYIGTKSGGNWVWGEYGIYENAGSDCTWGGCGAIDQFGGVGINFKHTSALNNEDYIYYRVTARASGGTVDISGTDNMLISIGNDKNGANTHKELTLVLEGGTQTGYNWSNSCKNTIQLGNYQSISTYKIPMTTGWTCDSGSMSSLKSSVSQVVVKVLPGGNNTTSDAASGNTTETFIKLGAIAFSKNP